MLKLIREALSRSLFLASAVLLILVDQGSKYAANLFLRDGATVSVLPFFDLELSYNLGAAFGMLNDAGGWQVTLFAGFAIATIAVVFYRLVSRPVRNYRATAALTLILAGAAGNLIDRVSVGYVIDFVLLHWQEHKFPIFNLADIAITVGALILLADIGSKPAVSNVRNE